MYPPPYHNPVMRSGEWKLWLEAAFGAIRNLDVSAGSARSSGSDTFGATWTELFTLSPIADENKAALSVAIGGFDPYVTGVTMHHHCTDLYDEQGREWDTTYASIITSGRIAPRNYPYGITDRIYLTDSDFACEGDFTLEMFVEFLDFPSSNQQLGQSIFWCGASWNGPGAWLNCQNNTNTLYWTTAASYASIRNTGVTLNKDIEYHLAIAREGQVTRLFLDGVEIDSDTTATPGTAIESGYMAFGGTQVGGLEYFKIRLDELRLIDGEAIYTTDFTPPIKPLQYSGSTIKAELRLLVNGTVVETVSYPSAARQFFDLSGLKEGDVISVESKYIDGEPVDWWYTYEASTSGVESGGKMKYPAPEYLNDDPRWIGRWTDIYKMLLGADGRTPGSQKSVATDDASSDSHSYTASTTDTLCSVTVAPTRANVRIECFSRSLFTAFELHKDGVKIADLSMFTQRGKDGSLTESTLCHDIVYSEVTASSHTYTLKGVATTTESGHMEASLHVVY